MKDMIRREILNMRRADSGVGQSGFDELITRKICSLYVYRTARKVLMYKAIKGEVHLDRLVSDQKKQFFLPRISGNDLQICRFSSEAELVKNSLGIREPGADCNSVSVSEMDVVLVPGVAFSMKGHRIGFGKGYYDRLLAGFKGAKIGIAYEYKMVENEFEKIHDIPMDIIVTEKKIIHIHK